MFLPISAFAFIGGLVNLAGGSLDLTIVNPVKPASGAAFSWAFLQGLNAIFGVSPAMRIRQEDALTVPDDLCGLHVGSGKTKLT